MQDERRLPDEPDPGPAGPPEPNETGSPTLASDAVYARFSSSQALDDAIRKLETAGFDRDSLGLPDMQPDERHATPEAGSKTADTGADARQARVLHASTGGAIGAMVAATAVAATGGVAAAVAGAALGAGAAVGGLAHLLSGALSHSEQQDRERRAAEGRLVLGVRALTPERHERAVEILRETGGILI
jgi:hypothetical protein